MSTSDPGGAPRSDDRVRGKDELDDYVRAFERAYSERGGADPSAFLPPADHPLHAAVLRELLRVDLEYSWDRGTPKDLAEYRRDFPLLAVDPDALRGVAFEEFRLRRLAGQSPTPDEYFNRYGVRFDAEISRLRLSPPAPRDDGPDNPRRGGRGGRAPEPGRGGGRASTVRGSSPGRSSPPARGAGDRGPKAWKGRGPVEIPRLPEVGDEFLGFRLIKELGRGSFGRVYLARQGDLADRQVVLKVTADGHDESQTLAQLRHDNIVPVYSCHRAGALRAVCMPYLGSVTLRDIFEDLKAQGTLPGSGRDLLSSLGKSSERKGPRAGVAELPTEAAPGAVGSAAVADPASGRPWSEDGAGTQWPADPGGTAVAPAPTGVPERTNAADGEGGAAGSAPPADAMTAIGALTYVEAVVWMAAHLADGLAHAHARGILHRDIKPANILLTDDGRPMLLDFNLAEDLKHRSGGAGSKPWAIGGTLSYMAPEHLDAFRGGGGTVDARSDLYAFGVIVFEMLTGRPPFPVRDGRHPETLDAMILDRRWPPPRLRPWNPAVSPAVESIVRRCLEPDPADRYRSARELGEDLRRHLAHLPLRHAPDPSRRERAAKWLRRYRGPAVVAAALLIGSGAVGGLAAVLAKRSAQAERFHAVEAAARFRAEAVNAQNTLALLGPVEPAKRDEGLKFARHALKALGALDDDPTPWWERPPADGLDPADRDRLRSEAGDLLQRVAWAEVGRASGADRDATLREALAANQRAERCFPAGKAPRTVWSQRADVLTRLGDHEGAKRSRAKAAATPRTSALDFALAGAEQAVLGRHAEALALLDEALRRDPCDYKSWLQAGVCHERLMDDHRAEACFSTCIALREDLAAGWFDRGLILLKRGKPALAADDFDRAIRLRPETPDPVIDRAIAAMALGRPREAVDGFTRALDMGAGSTRLYFLRSQARAAAGDPEGARRDRDEGLRREPTDELSWVVRGRFREDAHDHTGALADLDRALALNPRQYHALRNKAALLDGSFADPESSARVLDRLLEFYPHDAESRAARAVLRARLGRRDAALADASAALDRAPRPDTYYRAACAFALTSRDAPDDRAEAFRLLGAALAGGFGRDLVADDPDLDPLRDDPQFARVVARSRTAPAPEAGRPAPTP